MRVFNQKIQLGKILCDHFPNACGRSFPALTTSNTVATVLITWVCVNCDLQMKHWDIISSVNQSLTCNINT